MFFMRGRHRLKNQKIEISVDINNAVMERIAQTVSHSNVEEGGKLLGYLNSDTSKVTLKVVSYIDSGPNVSNSTSHLLPNGGYQEAMFRVIESFNSNIEHLGSWHSHHCNGFSNLSDGDIRGYIRSVNNTDYNLEYFFVILITAINKTNKLKYRCYIFQRGVDEPRELNESEIHFSNVSHPTEPLLKQAELASFNSRGLALVPISSATKNEGTNERPKIDDYQKQIRAEDQKWIKSRFPAARAYQTGTDGLVFWKWPVKNRNDKWHFRYIHPLFTDDSKPLKVRMEILYEDTTFMFEESPLDKTRFETIKRFVEKIERSTTDTNENS